MSLSINSSLNDYLPPNPDLACKYAIGRFLPQLPPQEENEVAALLNRFEIRDARVDILLNQVSQLRIPCKHRLQALELLAKANDPKQSAIAFYLANHLSVPDEKRLDALELFLEGSFEDSGGLFDLANKLDVPDTDRVEVMRCLACIPSWHRIYYCQWIEDLCQGVDWNGKIQMMHRYLSASWQRRSDLLNKTLHLREYFEIDSSSNLPLIHAVENSDSLDDRYDIRFRSFLRVADSCMNRLLMDEQEINAVLLNLSKVSFYHWNRVDQLIKFWMSTEHKIAILEACGAIPEHLFEYAAEQGSRFITLPFRLSIAEQKALLIKAALVPEAHRATFNAMPREARMALLRGLPLYSEKEQLAYFEMSGQDWAYYSQLQGEEKWNYLSHSHDQREARRLAIEDVLQEIAKEETILIMRRYSQIQDPEWSEDPTLVVNALELSEHPHRALLDFLHKKQSSSQFPMIEFEGPEAIEAEIFDHGGVLRDFTRILFDALCQKTQTKLPMIQDLATGKWIPQIWHPDPLLQDEKAVLPPSQFGVFSKKTQIACYESIGLFFAIAFDYSESLQPVTIGVHFHESVFEMLQAYSPFSSADTMYKKLFHIFLRSNYADLFAIGHRSASNFRREVDGLLEGKISQRLQEQGFDKELLSDLLAKSRGVIEAILVIAKSMHKHSSDWKKIRGFTLHSPNAKTLREKIEGEFSKKHVLRAFDLDNLFLVPPEKVEYMQWLKQWIEESDLERVQLLVIAISGSSTLVKEQSLNLNILPNRDVEGWPTFRTCFSRMEMPAYPDYETFKSKLNSALDRFAEEMKGGVPFQGIS